jgi:hypothetical protein
MCGAHEQIDAHGCSILMQEMQVPVSLGCTGCHVGRHLPVPTPGAANTACVSGPMDIVQSASWCPLCLSQMHIAWIDIKQTLLQTLPER